MTSGSSSILIYVARISTVEFFDEADLFRPRASVSGEPNGWFAMEQVAVSREAGRAATFNCVSFAWDSHCHCFFFFLKHCSYYGITALVNF